MNRNCKTTSSITTLRMALLVLLLLSNHVFAGPFADLLKGVVASLAKANNQQAEEAQRLELDRQIILAEALAKDYLKTNSFSDQEAKKAIKQLITGLRANANIENIASAETVAIVNGAPIPQVRVNLRIKMVAAKSGPDTPELRRAVLDDLINIELMSQEARKKGFDKQPEIIQRLELAKQTTQQTHVVQNQQIASGGRLIESASQYCEAIENNKLIREFATQLARAVTVELTLNDNVKNTRWRSLDNNQGNLTQWVNKQLSSTGRCYGFRGCFDNETADKVMRWAGYCRAKHIDDELFFFFHDWGEGSTIDVANEKNNARSYNPPLSIVVRPGNRFWATLIAVALPNGINALETTGKQNAEELRAYLDANIKEHEKSEREAAEFARQEEEKRKVEREFANSPNGKLATAYQAMAAINQCVELREGYAMVYINDVQHTKAKKLMRRIEASLKNKLQGTTADDLWKKVASNVDIQKGFINAKLWTGQNEIQVCQSFIQKLEEISESVVGRSAPEKSW